MTYRLTLNFLLKTLLPASFFLLLTLNPTASFGQIIIDVDVVHFRQGITPGSGTEITAFPNPATTSLTIQAEDCNTLERVRIYDMSGRVVSEEVATGTKARLDLSKMPAQTYLIEIKSAAGIERKRIIRS